MASPYSIAQAAVTEALAQAGAEQIEAPRVLKALLQTLLQTYLQHHSADDIRSELAFELEHMGGDTDIPFMRP